MVTRLEKFLKDPNFHGVQGKDRGSGYYYLRGGKTTPFTMNGKVFKKPYYSKYSKVRDYNKKSTGFEIDRIGKPPKFAKAFAHVTDGNINKRVRR